MYIKQLVQWQKYIRHLLNRLPSSAPGLWQVSLQFYKEDDFSLERNSSLSLSPDNLLFHEQRMSR